MGRTYNMARATMAIVWIIALCITVSCESKNEVEHGAKRRGRTVQELADRLSSYHSEIEYQDGYKGPARELILEVQAILGLVPLSRNDLLEKAGIRRISDKAEVDSWLKKIDFVTADPEIEIYETGLLYMIKALWPRRASEPGERPSPRFFILVDGLILAKPSGTLQDGTVEKKTVGVYTLLLDEHGTLVHEIRHSGTG